MSKVALTVNVLFNEDPLTADIDNFIQTIKETTLDDFGPPLDGEDRFDGYRGPFVMSIEIHPQEQETE